jgi:hypothetical protein
LSGGSSMARHEFTRSTAHNTTECRHERLGEAEQGGASLLGKSLAVPKKTRLRPAALTSQAMLRLFLSLLVLAAIWVGLAPTAAVPAVVPATAPASEFSAERAMRDLAVVAATGPVSLTVQDRRLGLPAILGVTIAPRSAWMVPAPLNDVANSTIVRRTFTFLP